MLIRLSPLGAIVAAMSIQGLKHNWPGHGIKVLKLESVKRNLLISNEQNFLHDDYVQDTL